MLSVFFIVGIRSDMMRLLPFDQETEGVTTDINVDSQNSFDG
jgi:hypothetical protein